MELSAGNLYEANKKMILETEHALNHLELANKQLKLEKFFETKVKQYAMLLCHEQRDFTVFHLNEDVITSPFVAAREALGCCTDRGEVYSIEETDDKQAYEIWIKIDNQIYCYYLFPYDQAVIECK